jgi:hypothetical protein
VRCKAVQALGQVLTIRWPDPGLDLTRKNGAKFALLPLDPEDLTALFDKCSDVSSVLVRKQALQSGWELLLARPNDPAGSWT